MALVRETRGDAPGGGRRQRWVVCGADDGHSRRCPSAESSPLRPPTPDNDARQPGYQRGGDWDLALQRAEFLAARCPQILRWLAAHRWMGAMAYGALPFGTRRGGLDHRCAALLLRWLCSPSPLWRLDTALWRMAAR